MFRTYLKAENTIAILKDGEHFIEFSPIVIDGEISGSLPVKIHDDELMRLVEKTYNAHGFPEAENPLRFQMFDRCRFQREASLEHIAGLVCKARNLLEEYLSDNQDELDRDTDDELTEMLNQIETVENNLDQMIF